MKKLSLTIGIPAHNEEANICNVINDLLSQNQSNYSLRKLIVISDGSKDKTYMYAKSIGNKKLKVLKNSKRLGQAGTLNKIIKFTSTDALLLVDADIRITDKHFISKMVSPLIKGKADLTASHIEPISANGFIRSVLQVSHKIKNNIFSSHKNGHNVYTCYGLARCLSRKLYSSIAFPALPGSDMYSYLFCISKGMKFWYVNDAIARYELPDNLKDHRKQSVRYFHAHKAYAKHFGEKKLHEEMKISKLTILRGLYRSIDVFLSNPHHVIAYASITLYTFIQSVISAPTTDRWDMAGSSKRIAI